MWAYSSTTCTRKNASVSASPPRREGECVPICPRCKRCISAVSEPFPSVFGAQPVALTTAIDICNNKKCNSRGLVGWCDEGRDRLGAHAGNPAHSAGLGRRLCRRPQGPDRQCRAQTQLSNEEYQHILRIHLIRHPRSAYKTRKKLFSYKGILRSRAARLEIINLLTTL